MGFSGRDLAEIELDKSNVLLLVCDDLASGSPLIYAAECWGT